eukprot:CAMPEP_0202913354 /NCGR_PEP_ID=MMETSP1392-20130828/60279_1 /ASSEMBLY_ACC=CAM_ASM_000868 /TAXON_ID=225041 /ORGANISM="Chlamydomonas chlamydogama, Strain SAG 11-48b" /LENGTH=242 /DNA_ID=CAMNT_0049604587 /DNA_START=522 /DNA_END=1247 /DNA_ORIENTATION=+
MGSGSSKAEPASLGNTSTHGGTSLVRQSAGTPSRGSASAQVAARVAAEDKAMEAAAKALAQQKLQKPAVPPLQLPEQKAVEGPSSRGKASPLSPLTPKKSCLKKTNTVFKVNLEQEEAAESAKLEAQMLEKQKRKEALQRSFIQANPMRRTEPGQTLDVPVVPGKRPPVLLDNLMREPSAHGMWLPISGAPAVPSTCRFLGPKSAKLTPLPLSATGAAQLARVSPTSRDGMAAGGAKLVHNW